MGFQGGWALRSMYWRRLCAAEPRLPPTWSSRFHVSSPQYRVVQKYHLCPVAACMYVFTSVVGKQSSNFQRSTSSSVFRCWQ